MYPYRQIPEVVSYPQYVNPSSGCSKHKKLANNSSQWALWPKDIAFKKEICTSWNHPLNCSKWPFNKVYEEHIQIG